MIATLLLGSNLGDSTQTLACARNDLSTIGDIIRSTTVVTSPPWGFNSTHHFYNQIIELNTQLSPLDLLESLEAIERKFGRIKHSNDWQNPNRQYTDRTLDIDILYYGSLPGKKHSVDFRSDRLVIPHQHIDDRSFTVELLENLYREY